MDVAFFSNALPPQCCPVANRVGALASALRRFGHRVFEVGPTLADADLEDPWQVRVVPAPPPASRSLDLPPDAFPEDFRPVAVHSFDPFLVGALGLQVALDRGLPLVFTPSLSYGSLQAAGVDKEVLPPRPGPALLDALATRYAGAADQVLAFSDRFGKELRRRRVPVVVERIPDLRPDRVANADAVELGELIRPLLRQYLRLRLRGAPGERSDTVRDLVANLVARADQVAAIWQSLDPAGFEHERRVA